MKIFKWISDNVLFVLTLFLLAFIPLYPKKPILDVVNTWVYVRLEDFVIVGVLLIWLVLLFRKKITIKTPLTMPILLFWIAGALSTIHGVLLIFPDLANVFPNVALLSFLRRIEYLSLFFVSFAAIKDKKMLPYVVTILTLTLFAVVVYGVGQKYAGFPAYLTMNEEFAKGEAIHLSSLSRVPSTFGGHYDLAAYLVLIIPLMASLFFGVKNLFAKLIFLLAVGSGIILLYFTISRVSFFVLFLSLAFVLFFYKRKWFFFLLPIVILISSIFFINFAPRLIDRFSNTVKEIDVLVDANTGIALGNIKDIDYDYFENRIVRERVFHDPTETGSDITDQKQASSSSNIVPHMYLPKKSVLLVPPNASTGESLTQGTGYINLVLSPIREQRSVFFYESKPSASTTSADLQMFTGNFLVKKALAYDLSLTTRYQGEWPHALDAFRRNIFLGSGYGSISLAIDNSYLRMLGETGSLGFISFFVILIAIVAYTKQVFPKIESPFVRSFVIGFSAGLFGLALNAVLIDVFEASKVAFYLWLLTGITVGTLYRYQAKVFDFYGVLKKIATSSYAIVVYLGILTFFMYSAMLNNYFIGDDFTWFHWAADGKFNLSTIYQYFFQSDGFFYRPGTKVLFLSIYPIVWLNPVIYHSISLILHFVVVLLVFILVRKIVGSYKLSVLAAFLFAMLSSYHEVVFWISSIGHIITTMFVLLSLLFFIFWEEKKKAIYFIFSVIFISLGLLFQELGVVAPLLIIFYKFVKDDMKITQIKSKKWLYGLLFSPVILYLFVRYLSNSHWLSGDYNYNLLKLPFNVAGNMVGYLMISIIGPISLPFYESLRNALRDHLVLSGVIALIIVSLAILGSFMIKRIDKVDRKIIIIGIGFMFISLLPFLGLGNITSRYSYLPSLGFVILFVFVANKAYQYLLSNGRDIAIAVMTLLVGSFFLLHIIQIQKLHGDWHDAGLKVNKFLIAVEGVYQNSWSNGSVNLNFVNVPIRNGEAWVFPVGLKDALWFSFKNSNLTVKQWSSVDEAVAQINDPKHDKVFIFTSSDKIVGKSRTRY